MHRLQQLGPGICRVLSLSVPARAPLSHSGKFCRVEGLKLPLSLPLGPGIQSPAFFTHPLDGNPLLLAPPSLPSTQTTGTGLRRGCFSLKVKSESEVAESCPTLCGLMGRSPTQRSSHAISGRQRNPAQGKAHRAGNRGSEKRTQQKAHVAQSQIPEDLRLRNLGPLEKTPRGTVRRSSDQS